MKYQNTVLIAILILLPSCATLFTESQDDIHLESSLSGVSVYLNGNNLGELPTTVNIERDVFDNKSLIFKKEGYKTLEMRIKKSLDKIALLNFTSWPSWITDAISGNMMEYSPKYYLIELEPVKVTQNFKQEVEWKRFVAYQFTNIRKELSGTPADYLLTLDRLTTNSLGTSPNWHDEKFRNALLQSQAPASFIQAIQAAVQVQPG